MYKERKKKEKKTKIESIRTRTNIIRLDMCLKYLNWFVFVVDWEIIGALNGLISKVNANNKQNKIHGIGLFDAKHSNYTIVPFLTR